MAKAGLSARRKRQERATDLCKRADARSEAGNLRSAFRLMLAAAKLGDECCQSNVGNFYSDGIGVRANRARGLYWYRRAYRHGNGGGAYNLGVLYRSENKLKRSLAWFQRTLDLGDVGAGLQMAKIYLQGNDRMKAAPLLLDVWKTAPPYWIIEEDQQEARRLLKQLGVVPEKSARGVRQD